MEVYNLIRNLEFEHYAIREATPDWNMTLWDFLVERGIKPDDIWDYSPQIGYDADQTEPEWM